MCVSVLLFFSTFLLAFALVYICFYMHVYIHKNILVFALVFNLIFLGALWNPIGGWATERNWKHNRNYSGPERAMFFHFSIGPDHFVIFRAVFEFSLRTCGADCLCIPKMFCVPKYDWAMFCLLSLSPFSFQKRWEITMLDPFPDSAHDLSVPWIFMGSLALTIMWWKNFASDSVTKTSTGMLWPNGV